MWFVPANLSCVGIMKNAGRVSAGTLSFRSIPITSEPVTSFNLSPSDPNSIYKTKLGTLSMTVHTMSLVELKGASKTIPEQYRLELLCACNKADTAPCDLPQ